ncbi:Putative fatty acyl-CoA reductase CG5065 [Papilio xuthus]|uniref:Fatty acyl-CoA reductase n=1 Tax=Papilio xuthus TaxID=66420 RepID=A0A194PUH6_PAPXU|nr:Putative fatty acyl-CoA reductase CG5065 [Papilio xuthus]
MHHRTEGRAYPELTQVRSDKAKVNYTGTNGDTKMMDRKLNILAKNLSAVSFSTSVIFKLISLRDNLPAMDPALAFEQSIISRNQFLFETVHRDNSAIQRFYGGRVIFITGGSGFMGKLLIEKLFRTCEIKKMYVMVRPKKESMPCQRIVKIFEDPVFDGLKKMQPNFVDKIEAIEGDIAETRLAYSHATRSRIGTEISEDFHESPASPDALIQLVETLDEDKLNEATPVLIKDWPNTYSFSKAVAEEMIRITAGDLPICVVKPAIVIPTNREPVPGWIDTNCVFGPSGLLIGMGLGLLHVFFADVNIRVNIVPGDIATNAVIATGWQTARRHAAGDKETKVYAVSNVRNPVQWGTIGSYFRGDAKKFMSPLVTYYPWGVETKSKFMFFIYSWLFHFIPAYIIDAICMLIGKPRRFVKLYEKVYKMTKVFSYFNCNEWKFSDDNLRQLYVSMANDDKEIFNIDLTDIDWFDQMNIWIIGLRKYIVKDGLTGTGYALKKYYVLRFIHYIISGLCLYSLWKASCCVFYFLSSIF